MEKKSEKNDKKTETAKPGFDKRSAFYEYVRTKRDKLHAQFDPNKVDPNESTTIFKGVSCYFTGCSEYDELRETLVQNGGRFDHFLSKSKTTHIVSDQLAEAKKKSLKNALIVKSSWIYDCVKAGKLLPTADYLLFKPLGIVDMFNGKSTSKSNSDGATNFTSDSNGNLVDRDAMNDQIPVSSVDIPHEMNDRMTSDVINRPQESPSKHSMNDKNLSSASVSISNVRCTVPNTLAKYIGEASCQLHIRLRELYLKGKSLTLTVGVKKANDADSKQESTKGPDNKMKRSLDLKSISTILPRTSNDVALINGYAKGLMSHIKVQMSHIKMIKLEMTNLEKCTEEEIAQCKSNAAAQAIPTFTTPLEEDKAIEGIKKTPQKQASPEPEIIDTIGPPAKKKLTLDVPEDRSRGKSPAKKSPAKSVKGKTGAKNAPVTVKSGPMDAFLKKKTAPASQASTVNFTDDEQLTRPDLSRLSSDNDPKTSLQLWAITSGGKVEDFEVFTIQKFLASLIPNRDFNKLKQLIEALYE